MPKMRSPKTGRKPQPQQGVQTLQDAVPEDVARFFVELMLHLNSRRSQISMSALVAHPEHALNASPLLLSLSKDSQSFVRKMSHHSINAYLAPHVVFRMSSTDGQAREDVVVRSRSVLAFHFTFFRYHVDFSALGTYLEMCSEKGNPQLTKKTLNNSPVDFLATREHARELSSACRMVTAAYPVFQTTWPAYLKELPGSEGLLGNLERLANAIATLPERTPTKLVDCVINTLYSWLNDMTTSLNKLANEGSGEPDAIMSTLRQELQHLAPRHIQQLDSVWAYIDAQGSTTKQRTSIETEFNTIRQVLELWLTHQTQELTTVAESKNSTPRKRSPAIQPAKSEAPDVEEAVAPPAVDALPPPTPPSAKKRKSPSNGIDFDLLLEAANLPPSTATRVDPRLQRQQATQRKQQPTTAADQPPDGLTPAVPTTIPSDPRKRAQAARQQAEEKKTEEPQHQARPTSTTFEPVIYGSRDFDPDLPYDSLRSELRAGNAVAAGLAPEQFQRQQPTQPQVEKAPPPSILKRPQSDESHESPHRLRRRAKRTRVRFQAGAPRHTPDPTTGWLSVNEYKSRDRTREKTDLAKSEESFSKGQFAKGSLAARMDRAIWCVFQREDSLWDSIFALIANGVDPNFARPVMGETAMSAAAFTGQRDRVEKLLSLGANPAQQDKNGITPAELATRGRHHELAQFLRSAEAQPQPSPIAKRRRMSR